MQDSHTSSPPVLCMGCYMKLHPRITKIYILAHRFFFYIVGPKIPRCRPFCLSSTATTTKTHFQCHQSGYALKMSLTKCVYLCTIRAVNEIMAPETFSTTRKLHQELQFFFNVLPLRKWSNSTGNRFTGPGGGAQHQSHRMCLII